MRPTTSAPTPTPTGERPGPSPVAEPVGEPSVCIGCGLCCDGTLFRHLGVIDASDLGPALTQLGVEVIVEADPPVFVLPCPALAQGCCTIYHLQRPRACGWFECDVSRGVAGGTMSRADARALIDATKALRDAVRRGDEPVEALRAQVARWFWRPDD